MKFFCLMFEIVLFPLRTRKRYSVRYSRKIRENIRDILLNATY